MEELFIKILYMTTRGTWGGVANYLLFLIKDQLNRGNDIWLISGTNEQFTQNISKNYPQVHVIIIPYLKRNVHIVDTFRAIFYFRKLIKKISPDIIHLNCIMSGIVGRIACIGINMNIIYNPHGWAFIRGLNKKYKWPSIIIEKLLSYLTNKIICVSDYEYKIASKYHIFKSEGQGIVIKNGAPNVKISSSIKIKDSIFRITMASRFQEPKNQQDLILSFHLLINELLPNNNILLYLLGDGPTLNRCKELVNKLNMQNNVIFTGKVDNVIDYYNDSDIITLITRYDAISISLIEALSISKPIIASNVGGVPETFFHNGYCLNNNIREIANSFKILIENPKLRFKMGLNSRKLYLKEFEQKKNVYNHNKLYNQLLNISKE